MRRLDITARARRDTAAALRDSLRNFGPVAVDRYILLIEQAYADLCADPERPGARPDPEISPDLRLYPLRLSRMRVPPEDRVGRPRHIVAFRFDGATVRIVRLLHDGMDLPRRLG
ncbi:type II toxin-antitoxin system RelE/ParE family toxin [uncultured Brevundimonas sp.]|uniref:type II toxin-antitoxin system RelE/ParE family toxin n=1 Tax=uncultured Brevundimonas sp. TaxID=213418 RepID=UPI002636B256|nr:type II toxin-antitoxin system RelE/ParE family toxin [uncultured Brevundimonas sp.]